MKKFIMILFSIFFASSVQAYTSCEMALKDSKPFLVLYSADYCSACKRFKPIYQQASLDLKNKYNFVVVDVQNIKKQNLCTQVNIRYIPTVYVFDPKTKQKSPIDNSTYWNLKVFKSELEKCYALIKK